MYKESQNYKRSYDKLLTDFNQLKVTTEEISKRLKEVTLLYKQKCSRVDFLEKTVNNLQSVIQTFNEASEEEDDLGAGDGYFDVNSPKKRSKNELGMKDQDFFAEFSAADQIASLETLGEGFLNFMEQTEESRQKEQSALKDAEKFTEEMMGEFFGV